MASQVPVCASKTSRDCFRVIYCLISLFQRAAVAFQCVLLGVRVSSRLLQSLVLGSLEGNGKQHSYSTLSVLLSGGGGLVQQPVVWQESVQRIEDERVGCST